MADGRPAGILGHVGSRAGILELSRLDILQISCPPWPDVRLIVGHGNWSQGQVELP
jgi:hypothetical protein